MENRPIIVVGTGRSGTSVMAGMLYYLGVKMGEEDNMIPADANNPTGHFEDLDFVNINNSYLGKHMSKEELKLHIKDLCKKRSKQNKLWGWKIPTTTYLVDIYDEVLRELNMDPIWIYCKRDSQSVIDSSIKAYPHMEKDGIEKMINKRVEKWKENKSKIKGEIIEFNFDDIVKTPKIVVADLVSKLNIKISADRLVNANNLVNRDERDPNIQTLIVVPHMSEINGQLVEQLIAWQATHRNLGFVFIDSIQPVDRARNKIIEIFETTNATHLFMIDSDTVPPEHAYQTLLRSRKDIVSGFTPAVQHDKNGKDAWTYNYTVFQGDYDKNGNLVNETVPENYGLVKVKRVGGACLMIRREVIKALEKPLFKMERDKRERNILSEDYYFCDKANKAGFEIYAHGQVKCKHYKKVALM